MTTVYDYFTSGCLCSNGNIEVGCWHSNNVVTFASGDACWINDGNTGSGDDGMMVVDVSVQGLTKVDWKDATDELVICVTTTTTTTTTTTLLPGECDGCCTDLPDDIVLSYHCDGESSRNCTLSRFGDADSCIFNNPSCVVDAGTMSTLMTFCANGSVHSCSGGEHSIVVSGTGPGPSDITDCGICGVGCIFPGSSTLCSGDCGDAGVSWTWV